MTHLKFLQVDLVYFFDNLARVTQCATTKSATGERLTFSLGT